MKKLLASGKTIEDAVRSGLAQLGVKEDRVNVKVLEQPSKGLFGLIGAKEAKVELELLPDGVEEAIAFLREVSGAMELTVSVERVDENDAVRINITGSDLGILIGRRGQTLDSLQYLTNIVANRHSDRHLRIVLDAEQFRERRRQTLEALSERMAMKVVRTRKEVVLEPMTSQERKIIHSRLQSNPNVKTYSQGDEPNRRIVIALKQ
ncbi:protein jag [Cohnella sp. CIP 111063]|jgi:spoIIIJ-associated protein|uniref:RNA-binding cell elongation regulator Jag/EloR n=1 Tax=unclassified Cohnella TaxID=2636738 RepID=UPI000B8C2F9D|nr:MULTISPECIES: RNA-binding cell elongation regulator Jag/EloR [unclassified Cohnella]OXS56662.1 protein jag [Cohnella sp. CIP 111063]PRX68859.1 spoIIIJ-associated protein [Cohnella sp. SGD-V74]